MVENFEYKVIQLNKVYAPTYVFFPLNYVNSSRH